MVFFVYVILERRSLLHRCPTDFNGGWSSGTFVEYTNKEVPNGFCEYEAGFCAAPCTDDPYFLDEQGLRCYDWQGVSCSWGAAAAAWGYTEAGVAGVASSCLASCNLCPNPSSLSECDAAARAACSVQDTCVGYQVRNAPGVQVDPCPWAVDAVCDVPDRCSSGDYADCTSRTVHGV